MIEFLIIFSTVLLMLNYMLLFANLFMDDYDRGKKGFILDLLIPGRFIIMAVYYKYKEL